MWEMADEEWQVSAITSADTTNAAALRTAIEAGKHTVTSLDNSVVDEPGKPTKQVSYKNATTVDSVSFFDATWNTTDEEWQVSAITSADTTNAAALRTA